MSINFMPKVYNAAACIWRALDAAGDNPDDFELSLSNSNGVDILLALGLPPDPIGGPVPIDTFAQLLTAALRRHLDQRSPEIPSAETGGDGRARFISYGRRKGYVEDRLGDLARLTQRSRAAGATHFGWS